MLCEKIRTTNRGVLWAVLLAALLAVSLAACGGGDDNSGSTSVRTDVAATNTPDSDDDAGNQASPTASSTDSDGDADGDPMAGEDDDTMLPTLIKVTAGDNFFDFEVMEVAANTEITVELFNDGVLPHNIAFLTKEGGVPLSDDAQGEIIMEGEITVVTFTTPGPGTYFINCTVHPLEMTGTFIVK